MLVKINIEKRSAQGVGRFLIARSVLCFCAVGMLMVSCHRNAEPVRVQGEAQGSYYSIQYFDAQGRDLQPAIDSLLDSFDLVASLWEEHSEIRRINSGSDSVVGSTFVDLLTKSEQMREYTRGAFDCRVGALVNLYGFGFKQRADVTEQQIEELLSALEGAGYELVAASGEDSVSGKRVLRRHSGVEFDFNAIAQGYSSDMVAHLLESRGIENYLIDIGGEVVARGGKPDGSGWTVGIERPAADRFSLQEIETAIELQDLSVVTSGNYRKYYEEDGVRYSHTLDPATGRPVNHTLLSVSVVSREAWYADAMATAFMVMGLDKALSFIADHPEDGDIQAVFFIYNEGGEYRTYATPAFQKLIKEI